MPDDGQGYSIVMEGSGGTEIKNLKERHSAKLHKHSNNGAFSPVRKTFRWCSWLSRILNTD